MSGVRVTSSGSFNNTYSFLDGIIRSDIRSRLAKYGEQGVAALRGATPQLSGETADSWSYEIVEENGAVTLWWTNSNTITNDDKWSYSSKSIIIWWIITISRSIS